MSARDTIPASRAHRSVRMQAILELPRGEARIWMVMQLLHESGTFTIGDVAAFAGDAPRSVQQYLVRLEKAGFAERCGRAEAPQKLHGNPPHLFRLLKTSAEPPRVRRDGSVMPELQIQRLWRTMRMLKEFTVPELAGYAEEGEAPLNLKTVRVYCSYLLRAGVLTNKGPIAHRGRHRFRLARTLGPRAPRILTANVVYDPNGKAIVGTAETREAVR